MRRGMNFILSIVFVISMFMGFTVKAVEYKTYKIGEQVIYNGIEFYVIANGSSSTDYVTLLKAEPLTVDEVNRYGKGHINKNTSESQGKVMDQNGYGYIAYYSGDNCGDVTSSGGKLGYFVETGCTNDYKASDIKYVVDAWSNAMLNQNDLKADNLGYKARLITYEELADNLGYGPINNQTVQPSINGSTPQWVYNSKYSYWAMSSSNDSSSSILEILGTHGGATSHYIYFKDAIRPVINLSKEEVEQDLDKDIDESKDGNDTTNGQIQNVEVPNTLLNNSVLILAIGIGLIAIAALIVIIYKKKKDKQ